MYFSEHLEKLRVGDFKSEKLYAERETSKKEGIVYSFLLVAYLQKIKYNRILNDKNYKNILKIRIKIMKNKNDNKWNKKDEASFFTRDID